MPPLPKKEGEVYHIVAMDWFENWKGYTGYNKVKVVSQNGETPGNGDETASTTVNEEDMLSDDLAKLHVHVNKETHEGQTESKHPGAINETEGFEKLLIDEPFLRHQTHPADSY